MEFLPVATRELQVAARKRSSFTVRVASCAVMLFSCAFSLWFVTLFGSQPVSGHQLFYTLSRIAFLCACLAGPALTADTVNEERNNGTLGLLFLTHLNSTSILLGKLVGHGVVAFYSMLAIVPVMALPALLGAADAESLAKTALVLLVTLTLSLVAGLFASTVLRKPWQAAAATLLILAVLVLGIPLATLLLRINLRTNWGWLELLSPGYSLTLAGATASTLSNNRFWLALAVQVVLALFLFALVTFFLPRVWKEGKTRAPYVGPAWRRFKYGSAESRRKLRTVLLRINPILWLSCRERFGAMGHALLLLALAFASTRIAKYVRVGVDDFHRSLIVWIVSLPPLYLLFCFRLATAASERFAVDRQAGALELIVCTPLQTREIIRGHWLGLLRRFWGAAILLLALHAFVFNYIVEGIRLEQIESSAAEFGLREIISRPLNHLLGIVAIPNSAAPFYVACLAVLSAAFLIVILWIALGWLGMALALKIRREILAPWMSLFFLAVPPFPVFIIAVALLDDKKLFASNLFVGLLRLGASGFFIVLANALFWLFLARKWTYRELRTTGSFSGANRRASRVRS